jgi:hypothetical protein
VNGDGKWKGDLSHNAFMGAKNILFMCVRNIRKHVIPAPAEEKTEHFMNIRCK